tara:strand:- start:3248 stop:3352 length:105 start_codon:yes stop_codon:yes gene_type:complete
MKPPFNIEAQKAGNFLAAFYGPFAAGHSSVRLPT